jgi:polyhydroxybutyrate depolymerase
VKRLLLVALVACTTSKPRPTTFGGDRPVELQVPTPFDPKKSYPLVLVLHGYGASGFVQEAFFGMNYVAKMGEAFVLAPDGLTDSQGHEFWNADPTCCDFDHLMPDDVGYLGGLIDDVTKAWPIDPQKILVLGHSNGGYMAYRMACDRSDVVSNIIVLAGAAASDATTCVPQFPVSVLHIHGTADDMVPYVPNAEYSVTQWATLDQCAQTRTAGPALDLDTGIPGAETTTATFDGCPASIAVELWTIQGAGHIPAFDVPTISSTIFQYLQDHRRILVPD